MLHTLEMAHTILDALPLGIFWKDKKSVYLGCNKWHADHAGINPEDIVGKTDHDLCWTKMADKYIHDDQEAMAHGKLEILEESVIGHDGKLIWCKTTKMPLIVNDQTIGVLGFWQDLSELGSILDTLSYTINQVTDKADQISDRLRQGKDTKE